MILTFFFVFKASVVNVYVMNSALKNKVQLFTRLDIFLDDLLSELSVGPLRPVSSYTPGLIFIYFFVVAFLYNLVRMAITRFFFGAIPLRKW